MKIKKYKSLFTLVLLVILSGKIMAQANIDMPKIVVEAFNKKYPLAVGANWKKLGNETYEVGFIMNKNKYEAVFSAVGAWQRTGMIINLTSLPTKVATKFKSKFPNAEIVEAMEIKSKKNGVLFSVEFKKGNIMHEAFFDEQGNYLRLEKETEEEIK